jgi:hypothetical protein
MIAITVNTGEICPITGVWSLDNNGWTTDWYVQGQQMPGINGGPTVFYFIDEVL